MMNNFSNNDKRPKVYTRNFSGFGTNPNSMENTGENKRRNNYNNGQNNTQNRYNNGNSDQNFQGRNSQNFVKTNNLLRVYVLKNENYTEPLRASNGASGYDIFASEEVEIKAGSTALVPTGLKMAIPRGYEMQIRSRSGLCFKHSIVVFNAVGTIDSDYRGEVQIILHNFSAVDYTVQKGDRIAQGVFSPVFRAHFFPCDELHETNRGEGGFGASGHSGDTQYSKTLRGYQENSESPLEQSSVDNEENLDGDQEDNNHNNQPQEYNTQEYNQ